MDFVAHACNVVQGGLSTRACVEPLITSLRLPHSCTSSLLGLPRRFERAVKVRVALEMPQRRHSAQTRAGVLLHEQDSEPAEREIRKKQLDSAVYIAILLWHSACHRFSARPVELRPNGAVLQNLKTCRQDAFTQFCRRGWACF